jgi:aminopeptidase N
MQEQPSEPQESPKSRVWILALGAAAITVLFCLALVIVGTIVLRPDESLPTIAAQIQAEDPATAAPSGQAPETSPPTPEAQRPLTPQPGGRSIGDPYAPELGNTGYDVQHYRLQLALDPAVDHVEGAATIEARADFHGLSELSLDFAGFDVTSVTVNGLLAEFARDGKKLIVTLPELMAEGEPFSLTIAYRGQPLYESSAFVGFVDHLGLTYPDGQSIYALAEPDGARYWFPANDHPRDKATFRFEIVVPQGLTAAANGRLLETTPGVMPDGRPGELFVWEHIGPMAPYLATVAVAQYERLEDSSPNGLPLRHYTFPESREDLQVAASEIGESLDWMAELFGPYPFENFGYVTARVPGGSLETQTLVLLSDG